MTRKSLNSFLFFFFLFSLVIIFSPGKHKALPFSDHHEINNMKAIQQGERLEFSINWMGINAGKAILEVGYPTTIGSRKAFPITSIARSNDFISRFFPVEDRVETFMDMEWLCPVKFKIHQKEGHRIKDRDVIYDQSNHQAMEIQEGKEEKYTIEAGTQDALSALYFFRTMDIPPPGESAFIKVYQDGQNWDLEVKVLGKEIIDTPIGRYNTIKTDVMARFEGIFLNREDILVWFTDDSRHIPLKMKSKVVIGSVTASLVSKEDDSDLP